MPGYTPFSFLRFLRNQTNGRTNNLKEKHTIFKGSESRLKEPKRPATKVSENFRNEKRKETLKNLKLEKALFLAKKRIR